MNLEYLRLQSATGTLATADLNLERGMPASIEAERSILGAILLDNLAYNEAAETLKADDFYLDSHRRLFSRIIDLMETGRPVDIITHTEELSKKKEVESIGGVAYIASLTDGLPSRPIISHCVRTVRDKA